VILGSYSPIKGQSVIGDRIRKATDRDGLSFHPIVNCCFSGGYYLHPRLPFRSDDFYFSDEAGDIKVLLSGSVYNRSELYSLCKLTGPVPDPQLVADLFLHEGPGFVEKLNGDFAIFILQPSKKQAYLFRDHVGIRPMAWIADRHILSFSSDDINLSRAFFGDHKIDPDYLLGYFKFIDYRKTPVMKVAKLLPGHFLRFSEKGVEITKYWAPEKIRIDLKLTHQEMISDMKSILSDAVRIRCDSRFNAGSHVSSGLDSGIVSTMARKEYWHQKTFYGFSWSPSEYSSKDTAFDERELVVKSCENADILPVYSAIDQVDFSRIVSSFFDNHGFFSEAAVVEQAVKSNTNLIFSGWGGDDFISTGVWIMELDLLMRLKLGAFFRRNRVKPPRVFLRNMLYYLLFPALGILDNSTRKSFRNDARYLKKAFQQSDRKAIRSYYFYRSRRQFHLKMLHFYHLQDRCENWMINGYRNGVEYRYPLLDKRIIEYMLKVPTELLCEVEYSRPVLRELSQGVLPEEVRMHRSKNDPVYWAWMNELYLGAGVQFMNEMDSWKRNPDLYFVDFGLLVEDLAKYRDHSHEVDQKVLFRSLIYLKAIHEFSFAYRQ